MVFSCFSDQGASGLYFERNLYEASEALTASEVSRELGDGILQGA